MARRCAHALELTLPMLIDELDDRAAEIYGGHPDRLYLIGKDGRIAYQGFPGPRGFRPDELEESLKRLLEAGGVRRAWWF